MATQIVKRPNFIFPTGFRSKTTSSDYVASRVRDPTFEKLMDKYKNLLKVNSLILSNSTNNPPSISIDFLNRLFQKLHLNRGATAGTPHIRHLLPPLKGTTLLQISPRRRTNLLQESAAINASLPLVVNWLVRVLSMSGLKTLPLRAIFKRLMHEERSSKYEVDIPR